MHAWNIGPCSLGSFQSTNTWHDSCCSVRRTSNFIVILLAFAPLPLFPHFFQLSLKRILSEPSNLFRNTWILGLGYLLYLFLAFITFFVFINWALRIGVRRHSVESYAATYAYAGSLLLGLILIGRSEVQWRKSAGLDDQSLLLKRQNTK